MNTNLLDKEAAAKMLGISVRGLDRLVVGGRLASIKIMGRRLFKLADVESFIESCRSTTQSA